jgi:methylmalonyl-CoA/ethylmalonyl-CoA epimerase
MHMEPRPGYDGQFAFTDFFVGDRKLELIESCRPDGFVDRFLARRGEGFHHLSVDVADGALDGYLATLEARGLRIVDRSGTGTGYVTAFVSPRTAPGILVQFWQVPGFHGGRPAGVPAVPVAEHDGTRFRVDHVAVAVRSLDAALAWFRRVFPTETPHPVRRGWDGTHELLTLWVAGFKMELVAPRDGTGPIARFLAERGEGFHHLAIDVDRLDPVVERLERDGVRVVGRATIPGGYRTAFVHPGDAHGILVQLWEEPDFGGPRRQ